MDLLSNSYIVNNLQYEAAKVAPYLVAAVGRLHNVSSNLAEFTTVKVERHEKRKFEGCYDLLFGEKASFEEKVTGLDTEVERLS